MWHGRMAYETGLEIINLQDIMKCFLNDLELPRDKIMPTIAIANYILINY